MPKIILTRSAVIPEVVIDPATKKPMRVTVKHKGRDQAVDAYDHVMHKPGAILDVSQTLGDELIASKAAREYDAVLDESRRAADKAKRIAAISEEI